MKYLLALLISAALAQQWSVAPITKTGNYVVLSTDANIIVSATGTVTLTLPSATTSAGRVLNIKTMSAQAVISNSSNVLSRTGVTAGTSILTAVAGQWAVLTSDGITWIVMLGN